MINVKKMVRRGSSRSENDVEPHKVSLLDIDITKDPKVYLTARDAYEPKEPSRIVKNMLMLGLSFTLIFTAFMATANLQSSINSEASVGMYSLAALYGAFLTSSLLLPPFMLAKLKCKWTFFFSISGYIVFLSAQFYPSFGTLVPAAMYLGTCSAPMWAAQGAYLTLIAEEYAYLKGQKPEAVLQRFFGIFFLCFHSAQVWGNMISSFVLAGPSAAGNETFNLALCGANFCPEVSQQMGLEPNGSALESEVLGVVTGLDSRPDSAKINMLIGIFVGCAVGAAVLIYFTLDSLKRYGENERKLVQSAKWNSLLIATIEHWKKPTQILVIPISVWLGIQEAFIGAEFTKAYISCSWGVENIGFVMMCFGICAAVSSLIIGKVMEYVGRPAVFIGAAILDIACIVAMLKWEPNPSDPIPFFLISGAWGIADGVWSPQIKALYGTIFAETREAAFSNAGLWLAIGFIITYLNTGLLCMETKLVLYMGFLVTAMICYGIVEVMTKLSKAEELGQDDED